MANLNRSRIRRQRLQRVQRVRNLLTVFFVLLAVMSLGVGMFVAGLRLKNTIEKNNQLQASLSQQIEEEKQRTEDIKAMKTYLQSDEYKEKVAREKAGLVKENEILFEEK